MARPPREGARWGEDHAPPEPEIPEDYARLSLQFGEPNLKKALEIVAQLRVDFPSLEILQKGELAFCEDILNFTRRSMEKAAQDGRVHSMPNSLEMAAKVLPPMLVKSPELLSLDNLTLVYGDEGSGLAARTRAALHAEHQKQAQEKAVKSLLEFLVPVVMIVAGGIFAGFVAHAFGVKSPAPWVIACLVAAGLAFADELSKIRIDRALIAGAAAVFAGFVVSLIGWPPPGLVAGVVAVLVYIGSDKLRKK